MPEVQLTRDSRDREEEEVGGGVEQLPSPAMRRTWSVDVALKRRSKVFHRPILCR